MKRIPYGTFKDLSPEEQLAHKRELSRRFRTKHRDALNARNKKYFERWKIEKPFVVVCARCGQTFNAPRNNRYVCPDCHAKDHDRAFAIKSARVQRMSDRQDLEQKVLELAITGMLQKEIADKLNLSQRVVSYICVKRGCRRYQYLSRK